MSNQLPRGITTPFALALLLFACSAAAMAQTPSPTPVNPATLPPGQPQIPPTAPPGTEVVPTVQPTPVQPAVQEPREPNFPEVQPQPLPPLPNLTRIGVLSSNMLTLSLNDAIRKALQNNNDIEVARDDVRFAEQQLGALQGVHEPIFGVTPQLIRNVTPQQSSLGGGGTSGTTSSTTFNLNPSITKSFEQSARHYHLTFSNSRTNTSSTFSSIPP